jgi:hypothetical protein
MRKASPELLDRFDQDRKVFLSGDCDEERLPKTKTPYEQESIQRQIAATDKHIDALVCELYGLTEEEARIVEGAT